MAWNSSGTITVVNGSTAVTGQDTQFLQSGIGSAIQMVGEDQLIEVAEITSDTELTLAKPVSRSSASGVPFDLIPTQGEQRATRIKVDELLEEVQSRLQIRDTLLTDISASTFAFWQTLPGNSGRSLADFFDEMVGPRGPTGSPLAAARLAVLFGKLPFEPSFVSDFARGVFYNEPNEDSFATSYTFSRTSTALRQTTSGLSSVVSAAPEYVDNRLTGKRAGIRIHSALTNLVTNAFDMSSWWLTGSGVTVSFSATGGPIEGHGYSTIDGYGDATSGARLYSPSISATASEDYATGVWMRAPTSADVSKNVVLYIGRSSGGTTTFETRTVTLTADWVFHDLGIILASDNTNITVRLIGTAVNPATDVDVAGWQLYENRSAIDAQIVTSRTADDLPFVDVSDFSGPEVTLSIAGIAPRDMAAGKNQWLFEAMGTGSSHRITLYRSTGSGNLVALVNAGSGQQVITLGNLSPDTPFRASISVRDGEVVTSLNGAATVTDTDLVGFPAITRVSVGTNISGGAHWDGVISDIIVFKQVLAPSVLRVLFWDLV